MRCFVRFWLFFLILMVFTLPSTVFAASISQDLASWNAYVNGTSRDSFATIHRFLIRHPDWPRQTKVLQQAERVMPSNLTPAQVIAWFTKYGPQSPEGMDRYLRALQQQGNRTEFVRVLNQWWPEARLTRDQQRDFYSRYQSYINRASHLKRFDAQLSRGSYSNAEGVAAVLGGGYPALARARQGLAQEKSDVQALISAVPASLRNDPGLLYERLRWRRRNGLDAGSIQILNRAPRTNQMYDPAAWWKERHIIARRLIEKRQFSQAYVLVSRHKQKEGFALAQAEWLSGWLALRFVNKPWEAFEHFEKLYKNVKSPISKSRGAYWSGRASEALGHPKIASQWYQVAGRYGETFYGQLARAKVSLPQIGYGDPVPTIPSREKTRFDSKSMVLAVKLLHQRGERKEVGLFLTALINSAETTTDYVLISQLARRLDAGHYSIKAAQALQKEKGVTITSLLYPTLPKNIRPVSGIESAFVHAIIRQESRFDPRAISSASARGYMQLMPATAKDVARQSGLRHQTSWLTSRRDHNVALGSRYLKQMRNRFDMNYAMASAAYNAGPGRVDRWRVEFGDPRSGQIDFIDWIELIPIYETRNYVQRVLEGVQVYRGLLASQNASQPPIHIAQKQ